MTQRMIAEALICLHASKGKDLLTTHSHCSFEHMRRAASQDDDSMERHFSYMPRLVDLVSINMRYTINIMLGFYTTLWVAEDRSMIWFMYRVED
jgi:hypothetical protein